MKIKNNKKAFSLVELSVVIIIIGILITGVTSGKRMIDQSKLTTAQALTKTSQITSIPDLALWLEPTLEDSIVGAVNGINLSNNEPVSSWRDISGNEINLTQSNSSNQPKYVIAGINNLPSLSFDGNSDFIFSTAKAPLSPGDDNFTLIAVWNRADPNTSSGRVIFEQNNNNTPISGKRCAMITAGSAQYGFNGQSNDFHFNSYNPGSPVVSIITVGIDGVVDVYTNSNDVSATGSINISTENIANDIFIVGAKGLSTKIEFFLGTISEIMVFDRNLKPSEITLINNYLSKKYNITIS